MLQRIPNIRQSLTFRLILWVGTILLGVILAWAYINIKLHRQNAIDRIVKETDRLGNTIRLGTHYAMMLNSREEINQIINNIGRQPEIRNIRIFNKQGRIKFSNVREEVDRVTDIEAEACGICHKQEPPLDTIPLPGRTRFINSPQGGRLLGIISPIDNEPGCSAASCHYHPESKKVLGILDVVVSLDTTDSETRLHEQGIMALAVLSFVGVSIFISVFFLTSVNRPIQRLIWATRLIGQGHYAPVVELSREDEIGQLGAAITRMGERIAEKQEELNEQRDEYQSLFEQVPCYITIQDRDLRVIRFNREMAAQFSPEVGDTCYRAYKGRQEKCEVCPVLQTFEDGQCHVGEEVVINKDGTETYWFVRSTPVRKSSREITAVMEISLDITESKRLEKEIRKSEIKYHSIFNNIPSTVFIVAMDGMEVLDCNDSIKAMYGYEKRDIVNGSFLNLFDGSERDTYCLQLRTSAVLNQVRQFTKNGQAFFVNMHVSPSEYSGREALLVVASDITERLMAEQQLIQASKMSTLGEMSTGVAHELNQPLAIIKAADSYLRKKIRRKERIDEDILRTMTDEIDSQVDRASKIINHLREFGRKSDVAKEPVQVNEALEKAHEMFDRQLRLREINVVRNLQENLPMILADANRLEQVFVNLLINARDAIEEKWERSGRKSREEKIVLKSFSDGKTVTVEVRDSGTGIPRLIADKIFEPFFTTKKVGQGTGLGLSISYGIIKDYEGTIRVESGADGGAAFIIELPVPESA